MSRGPTPKFRVSDWDWFAKARCKGIDVNQFFEGYEEADVARRTQILNICKLCPVTMNCAEYAKRTAATGVHAGAYWYMGRPKKINFTMEEAS